MRGEKRAICLVRRVGNRTFVTREYGTLSQGENLRAYFCKDGAMRKPVKKPEVEGLKGVVHKQPGKRGRPPYR